MKKFAMVFLVATLAVILALSASAEYHKSLYYGVLKVEEGAITVDGRVDEAYGEPLFWYVADGTDDPGDYTNIDNWFFTTDKSENADEVLFLVYNTGNYVKGYMVWTDSALYICADTKIQHWSNNGLREDGSDMWKGYCLQLNLFDFAGDQNVDYGIGHMSDESTKQANFGQNKGTGEQVMAKSPECNAKTTRDGEHVIYEVELKWEEFLVSKPAEKDAIGIDVAINLGNMQEEGGSQKQLFFVGEESYHKRTHAHYSKVARYYLVTNAEDVASAINKEAQKVTDRIMALPEDITKDNLADMVTRVAEARQAYDLLSDFEKPFVTEEALTRLKNLDKKIGEMSFPATGTTGGLTWTLYTDGLLEIIGEGAMPDYGYKNTPWHKYFSLITSVDVGNVITSVNIGDGVTSIGDYAFYGCRNLTSITIPDSVTSIGNYAFYSCRNLTSIIIPDSVTSIGAVTFYGCSGLTSITIPDSVTSIGNYAFYSCRNLTSITIPDSVTSIGNYAFYSCRNLTSIIIPDSVTSIGAVTFYGCSGLTSITIPDSVTSIGNGAFDSCGSLRYNYHNGGKYLGNSNNPYKALIVGTATSGIHPDTQIIVGGAFSRCTGLTSITIPNSVTSIGDSTFWNCSGLTSITIPESVTSIGSSAFYGCSGLTSITIPDSVTSIGYSAFSGCSGLTSITIPDSVTSIGNHAFYGCSGLTSVTLPFVGNKIDGTGTYNTHFGYIFGASMYVHNNSYVPSSLKTVIITKATRINDLAFYGCSGLTSVTIGKGVTSIGAQAFSSCTGLTSIIIPDSVTSIGDCAFDGCTGLTEITIPGSMTSIGKYAFYGCTGLTSIIIPDSVTSIGEYAFYGCTGLTAITIPDSVTSIGRYAFWGCGNLQYNDYNGGKYLGNSNNLYKALTKGTATSGIHPDTQIIAGGAFENCSGLISITIPNSVTHIGHDAFYGCSGLTEITIPDSVTSIGGWAFSGCSGLTSITIGSGVTSIGDDAFSKCSENLVITAGNQYVENYCKENGIKTATRLVIDSKTVASGYSFTVDVFIKNNSGFAALEVTPVYPDAFQLVSIENGTLIEDLTTGGQYIWVADSNMSEDGLLMRFTFTTSKDIELGDYTVDFIVRGCVDYDEQDVTIVVQSGTISVVNIIFGDATGDGQVNINDIVRLKKYIAAYDYVTETSTVDVGAGADANGDGIIDALDIVRLQKYLANYDYGTGTSTVILGPEK